MNLVIDIGNTQTKLAIFDGREMIHNQAWKEISPSALEPLLNRYKIRNSILSDVRHNSTAFNDFLSGMTDLFIELNENTPLPFEILYSTKDTLGKDRVAAAAGAGDIFPGENVLIIDMGTAITIDILNSRNQYLGGNISPGLHMRFQALHQNTAGLPLLQPEATEELLGRTTAEAVRAGVINGILFEISEYINQLSLRYTNLKVIITGGDANFFVKKLKSHIFVDSNLIFKGLNRILNYNEQLR